MSVMRQGLAYDMSLFDEKKIAPAPAPETARKAVAAVQQHREHAARASAARNIILSVFVAAVFGFIVFNYVRISELTYQISDAKSRIAALADEEKRLNMELDAKIDLRAVQKKAEEIGMTQIRKDQTTYIAAGTKSRSEVLSPGPSSGLEALSESIGDWFAGIGAYFFG